MPTYEYACSSCGNHLEVVQSFADEPLTKCERCGGHLRRVFHPVGVLFKGSGFYSTDARRKKARAGGDSKGSTDPQQKKESKPKSGKSEKSEKSESSKKPAEKTA